MEEKELRKKIEKEFSDKLREGIKEGYYRKKRELEKYNK